MKDTYLIKLMTFNIIQGLALDFFTPLLKALKTIINRNVSNIVKKGLKSHICTSTKARNVEDEIIKTRPFTPKTFTMDLKVVFNILFNVIVGGVHAYIIMLFCSQFSLSKDIQLPRDNPRFPSYPTPESTQSNHPMLISRQG